MVILRKGFTIIECLISILLLAIIMVGGMSFYFFSTGHLAGATHKRIAAELANARMEQIKYNGYAVLPPEPPGPPPGLWQEARNIAIGGITGKQQVFVFDDVPDYKRVEVKMVWSEAGSSAQRDVTLVTYIAPQ